MPRAWLPGFSTHWLLAVLILAGCASRGQPTAAAAAPATLDEPALMAKLRADVKAAPASALSLADEGERRFGDSAAAEERRAVAISALINLGRIGEARSRAYPFMERYADGPHAANVAAMTGVHATPKGPSAPGK
jgi:outer membrane murein-binding lipoprotein Lpp